MKKTEKQALGVGLSLAAIAAAAAGAYYFTGKQGAKNRKKVSQWTTKAKKEIVQELGKLEKVSKASYEGVVKNVAQKYEQLKNVDPAELQELITEAKSHWNAIAQELKTAAKKVPKVAVKAVKAVKATTKKVVVKNVPAKKAAPKKAAGKKK